jgi:hypothetical protein
LPSVYALAPFAAAPWIISVGTFHGDSLGRDHGLCLNLMRNQGIPCVNM